MNMDFKLWLNQREMYFDLLMATNKFSKDCTNVICDMIHGEMKNAPDQSPLTISKIQQPEFYYLMISDQKGGLATCGLCIYSRLNFIIAFRDYTDQWWFDHVKSFSHQSLLKHV